MTVLSMIVVETEGGGGVTSEGPGWVEGEVREDGDGEGELVAAEKKCWKCRDTIGRKTSSLSQSRIRMRYGNRDSQNATWGTEY